MQITKAEGETDISYPEPYVDKKSWLDLREEILSDGLKSDTLLSEDPERPVYGLNIAIGWPLPTEIKKTYELLFNELSALGPDVFVYPFHQTHITVMTIVNFKKHQNPGAEIAEIKNLVPQIISLIATELENSPDVFDTFQLDIGPPVLSTQAAFLPILNPTGEIFRLREKLAPALEDALDVRPHFPGIIHSTVMRILKCPTSVNDFLAEFESIANRSHVGKTVIEEILLTSETKPYMRGGEKLHTFPLGAPS